MTIDEIRSLGRPIQRVEAAAALLCDPRTIDKAINRGTIKAFRIGRKVFIPSGPFADLLERGELTSA